MENGLDSVLFLDILHLIVFAGCGPSRIESCVASSKRSDGASIVVL